MTVDPGVVILDPSYKKKPGSDPRKTPGSETLLNTHHNRAGAPLSIDQLGP